MRHKLKSVSRLLALREDVDKRNERWIVFHEMSLSCDLIIARQ